MKPFLLAALVGVLGNAVASGQWQPQAIKTDADFRGLCAVSPKVAWVSGTKGTFGRTTDGGKTWTVGTVPEADKLDFRDVEAFGEDTAYLLSAGPGEDSRIYKTTDGGKTWGLQFKNAEPKAFFDAIAFWDEKHGIALSDPVDGRFHLIVTDDGGAKWTPLPEKSRPAALPKEGAFAASGTCLVTRGESDVWFCTGGAKSARVFRSDDRGKTWTVSETPLLAGIESAGVFSIAFRDRDHGVIVGGDYRKPDGTEATGAVTADGGKTWKLDREAAAVPVRRRLGEGPVGRRRHVGVRRFGGRRCDLEAAGPGEVQQRRLHRDGRGLGRRPERPDREVHQSGQVGW